MAITLAEIRAKLAAAENRGSSGSTNGDGGIYPHWNIEEGTSVKVRFLPDADAKNSFFWVERAMIKLPFAGIKGQADSRPVVVQVPCTEMYGKDTPCPILAEVRTWFKDPALEEMGRRYWKKKSYLFQGFVRENPLKEDRTPENPIRRFIISPQIFNLIKGSLMDPELENLPTDYEQGLDFTISKTSKGGYADYSTSKWARRESALSAEDMAMIERHGLFNLGEFLPKKPGEVELRVIKDMFEASVDGQEYDAQRWGQYYKPPGFEVVSNSSDSSAVAKTVTVASSVEDHVDDDDVVPTAPVKTAESTTKNSSQRAEDILAMIRNRQKQ
ncbi:MAG: hypothetical protein EBT86_09425 [Actinobacteria bacterium]|nr:hypothetical protein [Actinomycetota bacterium]